MSSDVLERLCEVHTSGRKAFKRCRRKWWLRDIKNLQPKGESSKHLWFGSGFHFALEDYHSYRRFDTPMEAFMAYVDTFTENELPAEAPEMIELAEGMFNHYINYWSPRRDGEFETYYLDGEAQVEVDFVVDLPALSEDLGVEITYQGTFDRVVTDPMGDLWVEDYKTAARIDTSKLETDPQISVYRWAAESWYGVPFEGVLFTQFRKDVPKPPRILKSGNLSIAKNQKTTFDLYREELMERYPDGAFPDEYVEMLAHLREKESPEGDDFIRRDQVWRNEAQAYSEYEHICMEIRDMFDAVENGRIYSNKTRDCSWDCDFRTLCIAMDDGSDWKYIMDELYEESPPRDAWKEHVYVAAESANG